MTAAIVAGTVYALSNGAFSENGETYRYNQTEFTAYNEQLPLGIADLFGHEYEGYSTERRGSESILLANFEMRQTARLDAPTSQAMPGVEYSVIKVKLPLLYGVCRAQLLKNEDEISDGKVLFNDHYEPVDAAPWGADEAYQRCWSSGFIDSYLLCYEDRFVEITMLGWTPTAEQMHVVGEKLSRI